MHTLSDFSVLILPGLNGSGPEHWQSYWQQAFPDFRRVALPNPERPVFDAWAAPLSAAVTAADRPVLLVAHSLGTCLVVRWAKENPELARKVAGAFLVAVTDMDRFEHLPDAPMRGFAPVLLEKLPFAAVVVASHNDERVSFERAADFAKAWGARLVDIGNQGHIGSAARLGVWPAGLVILGQLLAVL